MDRSEIEQEALKLFSFLTGKSYRGEVKFTDGVGEWVIPQRPTETDSNLSDLMWPTGRSMHIVSLDGVVLGRVFMRDHWIVEATQGSARAIARCIAEAVGEVRLLSVPWAGELSIWNDYKVSLIHPDVEPAQASEDYLVHLKQVPNRGGMVI